MDEQTPNKQENQKEKKTYQKPKLIRYGSLKELTKFGGSMAADFFGMQA